MGKLIRMDLYRMLKSKSFLVCLTIAFVLALVNAPVAKLMYTLANSLSSDINETFPAEVNLSGVLSDPFPMMGLMLALLSLCFFFYADVENGYIKNIAGQMAAAGIIGNLIGTILVQRIVMDAGVADSIRVLALKLLLVQSLCAMLVLVVSTLRSKSLGMILAVLFGLGLTSLIYMGINEGLKPIFGQNTDISSIMPDTVMNEKPLDTLKALAIAVVTGIIFLLPAIRIFDKKDVI